VVCAQLRPHTHGKKHRGAPWPCVCLVGRFAIPQALNTRIGSHRPRRILGPIRFDKESGSPDANGTDDPAGGTHTYIDSSAVDGGSSAEPPLGPLVGTHKCTYVRLNFVISSLLRACCILCAGGSRTHDPPQTTVLSK